MYICIYYNSKNCVIIYKKYCNIKNYYTLMERIYSEKTRIAKEL